MINPEIIARFCIGAAAGAFCFYLGFLMAGLLISSGRPAPKQNQVPVELLNDLDRYDTTDRSTVVFDLHASTIAEKWRRFRDIGQVGDMRDYVIKTRAGNLSATKN